MDKEFENWLKENEVFDYYITHPEQQAKIYEEFQWEYFNRSGSDDWITWFIKNPELAKKHFTLLVKYLEELKSGTSPIKTANYVQELPKKFKIWKAQINDYEGEAKKDQIKGIISFLNDLLNKWYLGYKTEIERAAIDSVRPYIIEYIEELEQELSKIEGSELETKPLLPIDEQKPVKYTANEYALTYIFDLFAIGQQVPINRVEGGFDAKKIKKDVCKFPDYDKAPDTFYRAVTKILKYYDLNNENDLQNISNDWLNAVRNLSTNWPVTKEYLKEKKLLRE